MKIYILVLLNLDVKSKRLSIDSVNWSQWVIKRTRTWVGSRDVGMDLGGKKEARKMIRIHCMRFSENG